MTIEKPSTVIKKYANRRLYHTGSSAYVTLDDLADMVRSGEDFVVQDAKTGEDITRGVLGQIIFDAESKGGGLLPIAFLRQLITFYDGRMQTIVPTYLEHSLASFAREQEKLRQQWSDAVGEKAFSVVEDQVRRNMDMFQRSMRMFMPFATEAPQAAPPTQPQPPAENLAESVAALRSELATLQARMEALTSAEPKPTATKPAAAKPADGDGAEPARKADPVQAYSEHAYTEQMDAEEELETADPKPAEAKSTD
ncbi:polyhydroxyalkanoate synthesis repressor PhaR [Acuticoccus sediminis]|uniref:Polyhydroxyalkanoate synthesis repressor PhaR n=2 Tax=Acuticoccus sediminis TaxID=2184697 RepID=A0A8B2NQZ1_9HYPH|nr:polyhydroxyalkanoate synthesis repressor PhaR [Acuticoccus sediminis]RAH98445.1 polyhydroxyalkanoate synthesis repressor PhaR [Acuticoccus sediminis]